MTLKLLLDAFERTPLAFDLRDRLPNGEDCSASPGCQARVPRSWSAWLARAYPERLLTVVATTPADAERWITDLHHLTDLPVALYPQREALGEEEPHLEIAGERAETLAALLEGRLRILVTTAAGQQERTRVPTALREQHPSGRPDSGARCHRPHAQQSPRPRGDGLRPGADGSRRSPSSASAGGSSTSTASGWRRRPGWSGGATTSSRSGVFDLTTQRSGEPLDEITVLPLAGRRPAGGARAPAVAGPRQSLLELLPAGTLMIEESPTANAEEVGRAWREAEHHLDVARRLGEEVRPAGGRCSSSRQAWQAACGSSSRGLTRRTSRASLQARLLPAGAGRPGHPPAARPARRASCPP